jgi:hypothetical protein
MRMPGPRGNPQARNLLAPPANDICVRDDPRLEVAPDDAHFDELLKLEA